MTSPEPGLANPPRILLVDDEVAIRAAFARLLRRNGILVVEAKDGADALAHLRAQDFDAMVSDVQMPDMDGLALLREVRTHDSELSVLLISGAPDLPTALQAVEYGAFEYLTKPLSIDKLVGSVTRAAETSRKRREEKSALELVRSGERPRIPQQIPDSWTGMLLGGKYRIGTQIGAGGMGSVYEAVREDLGQMPVAIKIVHSALCADPTISARFRQEATALASLNHPNIVRVFDFQAPTDEPAILVMERLEGMSLAALIGVEGPLAVGRVTFIAGQILSALSAAHEIGIVHRDLKPENIFLTCVSDVDDIVRLLDFGIVKQLGQDVDMGLTRTGAVVGTPAYMSPEQAKGLPVDARTDVYAVGSVMYEALAGIAPFRAQNYNALLLAIQQDTPPSLAARRPDVDSALAEVIFRALAKNAEDRYQSAAEMMSALRPWLPAKSVPAKPPEESTRPFAPTAIQDDPRIRITRREGRGAMASPGCYSSSAARTAAAKDLGVKGFSKK